ncbi:hypothetical protein EVJ58_g7720 [Rhodofomes roseus]|uniref:Uncharacterized protein n=1 Tax=Rhodofomes roseus TaxID=34475 RepID=A0A4Y9Y1S5_9APHY|nr:hypothetical protein EVJ58_g7720 [Rhodofomes roseus]
MLSTNNVPASKAMGVAGKLSGELRHVCSRTRRNERPGRYKTHNTPSQLGQLTDGKLKAAGVDDKDVRKLVLAAIRKSGYKVPAAGPSSRNAAQNTSTPGAADPPAESTSAQVERPRKKRKRDDDLNELLPDRPPDDGELYGSLEFKEVLDETVRTVLGTRPPACAQRGLLELSGGFPVCMQLAVSKMNSGSWESIWCHVVLQILMKKSTAVNRAPIMMAWAFVVAERLGFQREEALSIASVYTEMNAITKGVSLGIFDKDKGKGVEAAQGGSQPYVDLMGRRVLRLVLLLWCFKFLTPIRRIPLYQTANGSWRALSSGTPVAPSSAFSYITRALRQTAPFVLGALRLLANSYAPAELTRTGFALYADFRPDVQGWGGRAEVRCATILGLRNTDVKKEDEEAPLSNVQGIVKIEPTTMESGGEMALSGLDEPPNKKQHIAAIEDEYEAALNDPIFDDAELNLDNIP